jgi:phage-related tail fiber protein
MAYHSQSLKGDQPMDNENISFEDFEAAFDDASDYQIDGADDSAETEIDEVTPEDTGNEDAEEVSEGEENQEEASEEDGDDADENNPAGEQMFTLKVNKEERQVGLAEMTTLAQKGADYDRVKEQLTESRQANQDLQGKLDKFQEAMDVLEMISEATNTSIEQLVEQVHLNFLTKDGKSESEARAEIRATKAEKQLKDIQAKQTKEKTAANDAQSRAQKEIAEFHEQFPGVDLSEALCNQLMPDVQAGMSLTNAYRKMENARKDAEIADLQRKLAAEKQNKKNRSTSPGSQQDSGGRRVKTEYDEFMAAFE